MGALANALRALIPQHWRSNGQGGLTSAADARAYEEHVADAIEQLEAQGTASRWHQGSGAPAPALGQVYDQYLANDTGDTHEYTAGTGWRRTGNLHGKDGKTPVKGVDYFDGYTPIKGVDYRDGKDGKTPVKGVDYFDGKTPVKGVDYFDGVDGSRLYQSSAAPGATDPGKVGDAFYHFLSATQYSLYDYPAVVAAGQNPWRLRFTSPAGTSTGGTGTAGVSSFNTRTGAVTLTAEDLAAAMQQGNGVTLAVVAGKLVVTATGGSGPGGHTILKPDGSAVPDTSTVPNLKFGNGLTVAVAGNTATVGVDASGPNAATGVQQADMVDCAYRYLKRAPANENITLSSFTNLAIGSVVQLTFTPAGSTNTLTIGDKTLGAMGVGTVFTTNLLLNGTSTLCTFYDLGFVVVPTYANVLVLECIGAGEFQFLIYPR